MSSARVPPREDDNYPPSHGRADRIEPTEGAQRRPALRRRLVQGRAPRPRGALRTERRRQDDAAPCARRRHEPPGWRSRVPEGDARRATRPAAAARATADVARVRALWRNGPDRTRGRAAPPRRGHGRRRTRGRDPAPLRGGAGAARTRGRLRLARPRGLGAARAWVCRGEPRPPVGDVLGRRADARVARARARRRSRSVAARRADEPPRRREPRVARARAAVARRRDHDRRARPLVPRGRVQRGARARGRPFDVLRRARGTRGGSRRRRACSPRRRRPAGSARTSSGSSASSRASARPRRRWRARRR